MSSRPSGPVAARLKRNWRALRSGMWLRPSRHGWRYRRIDRLYLDEDPWRLTSPKERARFALTNAMIAGIAPDCEALLEIGSGEGEQTTQLLKVARRVTGIEISHAAVERARQAAPDAEFLVGCAEEAGALLGARRFDIITACEMLYYAPDAGRVLDTLKALAPRILVTAYEKRARKLGAHVVGAGWTRLEDMVVDDVRWHCHLWRAPEPLQAQ